MNSKASFGTLLLLTTATFAAPLTPQAALSSTVTLSSGPSSSISNYLTLAQRDVTLYVLQTQGGAASSSASTLGYSQGLADYTANQAAAVMASNGFNLFANAQPTLPAVPTADEIANLFAGLDGETTMAYAPGALLAEFNPVPDVKVFDRGNPAIDNYPASFSPGSLLVGFGDDYQFTPPDLLLAGASSVSVAPTLRPLTLALTGVQPEFFAGAPIVESRANEIMRAVSSNPLANAAAGDSSDAPVVIESASNDTGSTPVMPVAPVSSTAVATIADVATSFMSTSTSGTASIRTGGTVTMTPLRAPATGQTLNGLAFTSVPEPGTAGAMVLGGILAMGWKLRGRKSTPKA